MAQAGQFGSYYHQVVDRLYHAMEWRFNEIKDNPGLQRESEILAKLLDLVLADQVGHDVKLHDMETVLRSFQKIGADGFTPDKYRDILHIMAIEEDKINGYTPHLFGNVILENKQFI